jgi:hypothetical protein
MEMDMQSTVIPQPGSGPELPFAAPSGVGLGTSFGPTREAHIERQLAALLIGISLNNGYEGRDPLAISDSLASGFVAELLGVSIGALADALKALHQRGLVKAEGHGLRLTNILALEELAGVAPIAA